MIFVFVEDGTVEVLESLEVAHRYEPIDVESQVFIFYDEDGVWLEPRFLRPNRSRFFGLVVDQGEYELVRNTEPREEVDPFEVLLDEAIALEPNPFFASLNEIRAALGSRPRANCAESEGH